jgi:hypothetical protein
MIDVYNYFVETCCFHLHGNPERASNSYVLNVAIYNITRLHTPRSFILRQLFFPLLTLSY